MSGFRVFGNPPRPGVVVAEVAVVAGFLDGAVLEHGSAGTFEVIDPADGEAFSAAGWRCWSLEDPPGTTAAALSEVIISP